KDMSASNDLSSGGQDLSIPLDLSLDMSGSFDMPNIPNGVSWAKFSLDFAQARCQHFLSCGQVDQAQMNTCITQNLQLTGWDVDTEISKGRLVINETQCIDAVNASRCDASDSGQWQLRCSTLLYQPKQANAAVCLSGVECTSSYCAHGNSSTTMLPLPDGCSGTCQSISPTGAACKTDEQCGPNSFCDNSNEDGNVPTNNCVAYLGVGDDCSTTTVINPKQTCNPGTTYCPIFGTAVCTAPVTSGAQGDACDPTQAFADVPPCQAGLFCAVNGTMDGATCQPKIASGQPCNGNATLDSQGLELLDNQCVDGTACFSFDQDPVNTAGTCVTYGGLGDQCKLISATHGSCKIGFRCDAVLPNYVGTCVALLPDGSSCATPQVCAAYSDVLQSVCIADNGDAGGATTCESAKGFGDSCLPGFQDGLCWPAAATGTSTCTPTTNGNGVCAPICS
ncbi:MAG TPA: hypothetical protein VHB97_11890, partial [Polyangia bacterium]|nr:hypothetical protein [Polyangia bacterium]